MTTPPATVFIHIGLHKTGTTYLQNVLRANRAKLRSQRVEFPGGPDEPVQGFAVLDLQGRRPRGTHDPRIGGSWAALVEWINTSGAPTALISDERLSLSSLRQVKRAVESFPDSQVHVIVTVRDLARVAVSDWQQGVKSDQTWTWQQFADAIKDPANVSKAPARGFWQRQDVVAVGETWESAVPAERLHVITVPKSGSPPDELLNRLASVVGFDASALTEEPEWDNETVGVAGTEVIRRVNERLGGRLNQRQHDKVIMLTLVRMLAKRPESTRFALPPSELPWIEKRAAEIIDALRERGYPVVGDLDELRPQVRADGRQPDDASVEELLEASLDALAMLSEKYAKSWWQRRKAVLDQHEEGGGLASKARGAVFRSQRKAAELADKNPAAAKMAGVVMRARERARTKARGKRA